MKKRSFFLVLGFLFVLSCNHHDEELEIPDKNKSQPTKCEAGHYGQKCEPCKCVNGTCNDGLEGDGSCTCAAGYKGPTCAIECLGGHENPCNGNGTCQDDGTCACTNGAGGDCSGCSGNKTNYPACDKCIIGYFGENCTERCPGAGSSDGVCSGRGTCNESGRCECNSHFAGEACENCSAGWSGPACADASSDEPALPADFSDTIISWRGTVGTAALYGNTNSWRSFTFTTTADLRDNTPASKERTIYELIEGLRLISGHTYFDGLFALAMREASLDSVTQIDNYAFNNGQGVPCNCFNTGENWNYVWTRDTSYAMDLGLALVDPERSMNSLAFKLADKKQSVGGGGKQIVQDTGSGGSWPISTDRVVWILGAYETLKYLDGSARDSFYNDTYDAIKNTIEADREVVYDPVEKLYGGEQSYLDWRENTYQPWTAQDTVHIGMAKALSTNVAHYIILKVAAEMAGEKGDSTLASKYAGWAADLKTAIVERFYQADKGLFASMTGTYLDSGDAHSNYDSLGQSLAILWDVATPAQAAQAIASYPVVEAGPPVIWPQQPRTWIYHNRSIWPFVTAYHLRAALKARNSKVVDNAMISLIRGAAFNLSNMENFEFTNLKAWADDKRTDYQGNELSGPKVNSRRQLWSVAGYISAVLYGIFGLETTQNTVWFNPAITAYMRNVFLAGSSEIRLQYFKYHGKNIDITIKLPKRTEDVDGFFIMDKLTLNGALKRDPLSADDLQDNNEIIITMKAEVANAGATITLKSCTEDAECYAPQMPLLPADHAVYPIAPENGKLKVSFSTQTAMDVDQGNTFNIYRDGKLVATKVTSPWVDPDSADYAQKSYCYSVTAVNKYGNESHHAKPLCYWGDNFVRADSNKYDASKFSETPTASDHDRSHFGDWGRPNETLTVPNVKPTESGDYLLLLEYGSGRPIDTGITCAVKKVTVTENGGNEVASDVVFMPHLGSDNWDRWGESSFMPLTLDKNKTYTVTISDVFNMSYFDHFVSYTGGTGGGNEVYNRVNLSTVKLLLKTIK